MYPWAAFTPLGLNYKPSLRSCVKTTLGGKGCPRKTLLPEEKKISSVVPFFHVGKRQFVEFLTWNFFPGSFTHDDFKEPIDIALDLDDNVVIADNGIGSVLVFETSGKLLKTIGSRGNGRGQFKDISAVTVAPNGDILVADSRIQVFNSNGDFVREIYPQGKGKGRYGGLVCDKHGFLLATRTEKAKSFIQVFKLGTGSLYSLIDSHGCKMKRPTGLAVMQDRHLVVVDIGNDCVRKYRYF